MTPGRRRRVRPLRAPGQPSPAAARFMALRSGTVALSGKDSNSGGIWKITPEALEMSHSPSLFWSPKVRLPLVLSLMLFVAMYSQWPNRLE
jgi:hypothetical protein